MASGVEELLDMLFDMVDEAKNVPLSGDKCMLERDKVLDLIDDIRAQFPVELGEAKKMMATVGIMLQKPCIARSQNLEKLILPLGI